MPKTLHSYLIANRIKRIFLINKPRNISKRTIRTQRVWNEVGWITVRLTATLGVKKRNYFQKFLLNERKATN